MAFLASAYSLPVNIHHKHSFGLSIFILNMALKKCVYFHIDGVDNQICNQAFVVHLLSPSQLAGDVKVVQIEQKTYLFGQPFPGSLGFLNNAKKWTVLRNHDLRTHWCKSFYGQNHANIISGLLYIQYPLPNGHLKIATLFQVIINHLKFSNRIY